MVNATYLKDFDMFYQIMSLEPSPITFSDLEPTTSYFITFPDLGSNLPFLNLRLEMRWWINDIKMWFIPIENLIEKPRSIEEPSDIMTLFTIFPFSIVILFFVADKNPFSLQLIIRWCVRGSNIHTHTHSLSLSLSLSNSYSHTLRFRHNSGR